MTEDLKLRKTQLTNAANWNGDKAMAAYADGEVNTYARMISQADRLWEQAARIR